MSLKIVKNERLKMRNIVFSCIIVFAACNDSETSFEKNDCVTAGASYREEWFQISGNCGEIGVQIVNVSKDGLITIEGNCDKAPRYEGCNVYLDKMSCELNVEGWSNLTETDTGKMTWAADGSGGEGEITIILQGEKDGQSGVCSSTYHVIATRL